MYFQKIILITVLVLLGSIQVLTAQTPGYKWGYSFGHENDSSVEIRDVAIDANNNIYGTGFFRGTVDFDPSSIVYDVSTSNPNDFDAFVFKLDDSKNLLWVKTISGTSVNHAYHIEVDSIGNSTILGKSAGLTNFGSTANPFIVEDTTASFGDSYILQLSSDGELLWLYSNNIDIHDFSLGDSSAVYFCGSLSEPTNLDLTNYSFADSSFVYNKAFVSKLNGDGDFEWAKTWEATEGASINNIASDPFGDLICIGRFKDSLTVFDGATYSYPVDTDSGNVFIQKLSNNGNSQWLNITGLNSDFSINDLETNSSGAFFLTGSFQFGALDLSDQGMNPLVTNGELDLYIAKFNINGSYDWSYNLGGTSDDVANAIHVDKWDNVYFAGRVAGEVDLDFGADVDETEYFGYRDCFVMSLDATDSFRWQYSFGGDAWDDVTSIYIDSLGDVVCVGRSVGDIDLDPSNYSDEYINNGGVGGFIQKMGQCIFNHLDLGVTYATPIILIADQQGAQYQWLDCNDNYSEIYLAQNINQLFDENGSYALEIYDLGCLDTTDCFIIDQVGINNIKSHLFYVFPNPTSNQITITVLGNFTYVIFDQQGRSITQGTGVDSQYVDLDFFDSGVYFVEISTARKKECLKLQIE